MADKVTTDTRTLAELVRAKFPGAYDAYSDHQLEAAWQRKYPGAYRDVPKSPHHPATAEEFTPASFGGFVSNAVEDGKQVLSGLNPLKAIPAMLASKKAEEDAFTHATEVGPDGKFAHRDVAFAQPGDRLARGVQNIPGIVYRRPVSSAAEAAQFAPMVPGIARGVAEGAPTVSAAAQAVKRGVVKAATNPLVDGAIGAYEGYHYGGVPGAVLGGVAGASGKSLLGRLSKLVGRGAEGTEVAPKVMVDPLAEKMAAGAKIDPAKANIAGGMSEAGRRAASPNRGGTVGSRNTADVVQEVLGELRQQDAPAATELQPTVETPNGQPPVTRGGQTPDTLARGMDQGTLTPEGARSIAEAGNVREAAPTPTLQQVAQDELARIKEQHLDTLAAQRGTPADVPDNPVAQQLERERQAASASTVPQSKSKRPTYTENDLKAVKTKWGTSDLEALREKYGNEAVGRHILEQRAQRHAQHYGAAKDLAAARRTDLGGEGLTPEQLREMLLDTMKQRSEKR